METYPSSADVMTDRQTDRQTDSINYLGNLRGRNQGYTGSVYKSNGISPAILSRDYKDPSLVLTEVRNGSKEVR